MQSPCLSLYHVLCVAWVSACVPSKFGSWDNFVSRIHVPAWIWVLLPAKVFTADSAWNPSGKYSFLWMLKSFYFTGFSLKLQTSLLKDKFQSLERMAKTCYCILKIFQVYGRLKWAENRREIWKRVSLRRCHWKTAFWSLCIYMWHPEDIVSWSCDQLCKFLLHGFF